MATQFEMVVDARKVWEALGTHQDQVPYAMSIAINSCTFATRKRVYNDVLPKTFKLRTKFVQSGLHVEKATKTSLQSQLGFINSGKASRWFMESQVLGQAGRTKPGNKPIWQPIDSGERSPRPVPTQRIIPSRRPHVAFDPVKAATPTAAGNKRRFRGRNEPKYIKLTGPNMKWPGIYYRESGEDRKLTPAYWLEKSMDIEPRLDLEGEVARSIGSLWPKAAKDAVERALKPRGAKQKPWIFTGR
jgi:hypothetical protein